MNRFCKVFVWLLLVFLFVLSGKNYFYAPDVVIEAEIEASFSPRFLVYYTTNEYDDFSDTRFGYSLGKTDENKISVWLPAEKIKRLLVVPYDWQQRGSKGRYVKDPQPQGEETYTLASPRIIDSTGLMVPTEDISLVESGVRTPADKPCRLSDGGGTDRAMYELKEETTFSKRFYAVRFVQVVAWALLCAWLAMWAVVVEPLATTEKKKHVLYAALAAVALAADFTVVPVYGASQNMAWLTYLPQMWRNCDFLHLALLIPLYLLYREAVIRLAPQERCSKAAKALAVLLSVFILLGQSYRESGTYGTIFGFDYAQSIKTAVVFFGYVVFMYPLVLLLFKGLNVVSEKIFTDAAQDASTSGGRGILKRYGAAMEQRPFLTSLCTFLVFYTPFLILKYPCSMFCDGYYQALQLFEGEHLTNIIDLEFETWDVVLNAHHPLAHTLLIIGLAKCGLWLGNAYIGFFLYSSVQLLLMAAAVSFSVHVLVKYARLRTAWNFALLLYFLLHPYVNDYMFLVTKDVMYAAFMLAYLSVLFACIQRSEKPNPLPSVSLRLVFAILVISAVGATLFRNEGGLLLLCASALTLLFRLKLVRYVGCSMLAVLATMALVSHLAQVLEVRPGSKAEMYSVPCQQLARTLRENREVYTEQEKQDIADIFDNKDIAYLYSSGTSDPVKRLYQEDGTGESLRKMLHVWCNGLLRSPGTYVDAYLHNYYLYFFPECRPVYEQSGSDREMLDLGSRMGNPPGNSYIQASQKVVSGFVKMRSPVISLPYLNWLMLGATYTWVVCILLAYAARYACKSGCVLMILPLCLTLMPFLGPTNGDYGRYTYPLMVCLPFVSLAVLRLVKDNMQKNNG